MGNLQYLVTIQIENLKLLIVCCCGRRSRLIYDKQKTAKNLIKILINIFNLFINYYQIMRKNLVKI
jgi:hypothetical protein